MNGLSYQSDLMREPCTDTGYIVASVLTDKDADDGSQTGPLLDRIDGPVVSFTDDGASDRDDVYTKVAARHPDAAVVWSRLRPNMDRLVARCVRESVELLGGN
jgi:hypothetical protein